MSEDRAHTVRPIGQSKRMGNSQTTDLALTYTLIFQNCNKSLIIFIQCRSLDLLFEKTIASHPPPLSLVVYRSIVFRSDFGAGYFISIFAKIILGNRNNSILSVEKTEISHEDSRWPFIIFFHKLLYIISHNESNLKKFSIEN